MQLPGTTCGLVIAMLLSDPGIVAPEDTAPPRWTIERVRSEVDENRKRLHSIYFESITTGGLVNGYNEGRTRVNMAAMGDKRLVDMAHATASSEFGDDMEWRVTWLNEQTLYTLWMRDQFCKKSREMAKTDIGDSVRYEFYLGCTGWWPPDSTEPAPVWALHECLRDEDCHIYQQLCSVGHHRCVVFEIPGLDKGWLDVDRGFALVRRERMMTSGVRRIDNSDFREMAPNVWLPWQLRHSISTPGGSRDMDSVRIITAMEVNTLSESCFVFDPAPGTLIYDQDRARLRQIPGGLHVLDHTIAFGRRRLSMDDTRSRTLSVTLALAGTVLITSFCIASLCRVSSGGRATVKKR